MREVQAPPRFGARLWGDELLMRAEVPTSGTGDMIMSALSAEQHRSVESAAGEPPRRDVTLTVPAIPEPDPQILGRAYGTCYRLAAGGYRWMFTVRPEGAGPVVTIDGGPNEALGSVADRLEREMAARRKAAA